MSRAVLQWCCHALLTAGSLASGSPQIGQWLSNRTRLQFEDRKPPEYAFGLRGDAKARAWWAQPRQQHQCGYTANTSHRPSSAPSCMPSYLQCRDQVCCLEQSQLADLVHDCRNLGVCWCRCGIRLPSPLYPLLCSSNGRADSHRRAGGADAAPQGARCGGGHVVLCIAGGRWDGWQSSCRTLLRKCERRCRTSGWRLGGLEGAGTMGPLKSFEIVTRQNFNATTNHDLLYESVEIMGRRPENETQHSYRTTER